MEGVDHPINPVQHLLACLLERLDAGFGNCQLGGKFVTLGFERADAR